MGTTAVVNGQPTYEELMAKVKALESAGNKATGGLKVSEKGAVSVYGLGKFPVTLYAGQWTKLAAMIPEIQAFIHDNQARLAVKAEPKDKSFELDKTAQKRAAIQLNTLREVAKTRALTDDEQNSVNRLEIFVEG